MRIRVSCLFLVSFLGAIWSLNSFADSQPAGPATSSQSIKIVFIGDSLSDGYGVVRSESFPAVVEQLLLKDGRQVKVINGGISGSLSSSAKSRMQFYLKAQPQIVVLELGGNDALKGTKADLIEQNLQEAIDVARKAGVQVLLLGIQVYANFGDAYNQELKTAFKHLSEKNKLELMPFVLDGVATHADLMQTDAKHPNVAGHKIVAANVLKYLEPIVDRLKNR